ncbi:MAG: hypothetical protein WC492_00740 [Candidatus Micrarchaeia archaeon]
MDMQNNSGINPNKLGAGQVLQTLRSFGMSNLDSELLADCINVRKSCMWQNNEEISDEGIAKTKEFLAQNRLGINVEISPSGMGKYIWEAKIAKY